MLALGLISLIVSPLLIFLAASDQVEDRRQDKYCCALREASDNAENKRQIINKNSSEGHNKKISEAGDQVGKIGELIFRLRLDLVILAGVGRC